VEQRRLEQVNRENRLKAKKEHSQQVVISLPKQLGNGKLKHDVIASKGNTYTRAIGWKQHNAGNTRLY